MSIGDRTLIKNLKPSTENVHVLVRVIKVEPPKVIQTKKGPRTISEAVVGDESGRVKTTLWGKAAGSLKEGAAVEITGAWVTSFRGEVQLNVGGQSSIKPVSEGSVPTSDNIPEESPKAPPPPPSRGRGFSGPRRRTGFGRRSREEE